MVVFVLPDAEDYVEFGGLFVALEIGEGAIVPLVVAPGAELSALGDVAIVAGANAPVQLRVIGEERVWDYENEVYRYALVIADSPALSRLARDVARALNVPEPSDFAIVYGTSEADSEPPRRPAEIGDAVIGERLVVYGRGVEAELALTDRWEPLAIALVDELREFRFSPALEFAEWFGYTIEPNPDSVLGFRVVSPSGKVLGGSVAAQIIAAWQKNPNPSAGGKGKTKGKSGSGKAAAPKKTPAEKARESAQESIEALEIELERSNASPEEKAAIQDFIDKARAEIEGTENPIEIKQIVKELKANIATYKKEKSKEAQLDAKLAKTKETLIQNLPSANVLAGTKYNPADIQRIIDDYRKEIAGAASLDEAKAALAAMKRDIAEYKVARDRELAAARQREKAERVAQRAVAKAAAGTGKARSAAKASVIANERLPQTLEEWIEYYAALFGADAD